MTWREYAACQGIDTELFFPFEHSQASVAAAKKVCRRCPVTVECLEWALNQPEHWGIWGGTTEAERAKVIRRNSRPHVNAAVRRLHSQGCSDAEIARILAMPSKDAVMKYRRRHLPETIGVS